MSKYFESELTTGGALTCPCGCGAKMREQVVVMLDELRELYGRPVYIEQGATCKKYSVEKVGRKVTSTHIDTGAGAIGIDVSKRTFSNKRAYFQFIAAAVQVGFTGFGQGAKWIGAGSDTRLHIDTKQSASGDIRSWVYGISKHD